MLLLGMALFILPLDLFREVVFFYFWAAMTTVQEEEEEPWIPFFRGEEEGGMGGARAWCERAREGLGRWVWTAGHVEGGFSVRD